MSAEQMLEKYLSEHPDYWEYENEVKVVTRLKEFCNDETTNHDSTPNQYLTKLLNCD